MLSGLDHYKSSVVKAKRRQMVLNHFLFMHLSLSMSGRNQIDQATHFLLYWYATTLIKKLYCKTASGKVCAYLITAIDIEKDHKKEDRDG